MILHGCSFTGGLIEKFSPRYDRRGISDDPAFRELDILSTLGVCRSSGKRDERTSCKEKVSIYMRRNITLLNVLFLPLKVPIISSLINGYRSEWLV